MTPELFSWSGEEDLDRELRRIWDSEVRDYLRAEGAFLRNHGAQAGYEEAYIRRVLYEHRRLEELVEEGGEGKAVAFSQLLGRLFRYKEHYLRRHMERILRIGPEDDSLKVAPPFGQN